MARPARALAIGRIRHCAAGLPRGRAGDPLAPRMKRLPSRRAACGKFDAGNPRAAEDVTDACGSEVLDDDLGYIHTDSIHTGILREFVGDP